MNAAPAVSTLAEALADLDVTPSTLTEQEKQALDRDGYVSLGTLVEPEQAARMARRLDQIAEAEAGNAGKDFHTEAGTTRLGTLVNKDPLFDICFLHPRVLAAIDHITSGNFGLSSITARTALPGEGHQALHLDHSQEIAPGVWGPGPLRAANALWLLDDFTDENGPTRLVPGTHRSGESPQQAGDPMAPHPDEVRVLAPAGTVLVIDAYTWHSGTRNNSTRARHLISAFFTPRGNYQGFADRKLNAAAQSRLSPAARFVIDHETL